MGQIHCLPSGESRAQCSLNAAQLKGTPHHRKRTQENQNSSCESNGRSPPPNANPVNHGNSSVSRSWDAIRLGPVTTGCGGRLRAGSRGRRPPKPINETSMDKTLPSIGGIGADRMRSGDIFPHSGGLILDPCGRSNTLSWHPGGGIAVRKADRRGSLFFPTAT